MSPAGREDAAAPGPILRRRDAIGIIVGIVIGAGIYRAPPTVAGVTGDVGWMAVAWVLGALVSVAGALCYAELATTYPHAGGDYHFLTQAFGRRMSFLYAWARGTIINPAAIALLAFVFGDFMASVVPLGPGGAAWAGVIVIVLTAINIAGLRGTARTQNVLTIVEVAGLVMVAVAGFMVTTPAGTPGAFSSTPALGAFGALQHDGFEAMVEFTAPVFWGFLFLVGVSVFVLRARDRDAERPFRVPLYPLTPAVFCAACSPAPTAQSRSSGMNSCSASVRSSLRENPSRTHSAAYRRPTARPPCTRFSSPMRFGCAGLRSHQR